MIEFVKADRTHGGKVKLVLTETQAQKLWIILGNSHLAREPYSRENAHAEDVSNGICKAFQDLGMTYKGTN